MRTPLYVRLDCRSRRLLDAYCRANDFTLTDVVNGLVAQLLFQVSAEFEPPPWLLEAVASGLPLRRCSHLVATDGGQGDEPRFDNLIRFVR